MSFKRTPPAVFLAAQSGDRAAMERIVTENRGLVFDYLRRYPPANISWDDAVQEAQLAMMQAVGTYDPTKGSFSTWASRYFFLRVYRADKQNAAMRLPVHAVGQLQRAKRDGRPEPDWAKHVVSAEALPESFAQQADPEDQFAAAELAVDVASALAQLPWLLREVILYRFGLHDYPQLSRDECAAIMGVSRGTISSREDQAKARLAELLADAEIAADLR